MRATAALFFAATLPAWGAAQSGYTTLYVFDEGTDQAAPTALTAYKGALYGTTANGTVFELSLSGTHRLVYRFKGGAYATGLIAGDDGLYGMTYGEGNSENCRERGCGTIFSLDGSGRKRDLYAFKGGNDGASPSSLVTLGGELFATTVNGGSFGCFGNGKAQHGNGPAPERCGTVVALSPSGAERVLYRFKGGADGAVPLSLIAHNGMLYGVTLSGGGAGCDDHGCGTVFVMSPSGDEGVLYRFKGGTDGKAPIALVAMNGKLYGTTSSGGGPDCYNDDGCDEAFEGGTVFEVSTSGEKRTLHHFQGGADGEDPESLASLVARDGTLYGTTALGGGSGCTNHRGKGCGTAFEMTATGQERILYRFGGGTDGDAPGNLVAFGGAVYGTTPNGGGSGCYGGRGCGTVFRLNP